MGEFELMGGPSILLVEDHSFQLIGLEMQLNRLGLFNLAQALDGADALRMLQAGRKFDLLLCDQHLPDTLGVDLILEAQRLGCVRYSMRISGIDHPEALEQLPAVQQSQPQLLACLSKPLSSERFMSALAPIWAGT